MSAANGRNRQSAFGYCRRNQKSRQVRLSHGTKADQRRSAGPRDRRLPTDEGSAFTSKRRGAAPYRPVRSVLPDVVLALLEGLEPPCFLLGQERRVHGVVVDAHGHDPSSVLLHDCHGFCRPVPDFQVRLRCPTKSFPHGQRSGTLVQATQRATGGKCFVNSAHPVPRGSPALPVIVRPLAHRSGWEKNARKDIRQFSRSR